jgi:hypothetical protein
MKHVKPIYGRLLTDPHEITEARNLWWRTAQVFRPSPDDWKVMRRVKELLGVTTAGDWGYLRYLTEELIGRAERCQLVQAKDLKVGDKVWYICDPTAPPLACEVQRITEGYRVAVRLLEAHPTGKKVVTISPSSALTSEAEVAKYRGQATLKSGQSGDWTDLCKPG